jgi:hypothetical protein
MDTLYDSGFVTFEATVSDPDGSGEIADVLLSDTQGTAYGSFSRFSESIYRLRINWNGIASSRDITFGPGQTESRTFVATVIDRASARATAQTSLVFACGGSDRAACPGVACVDVQYSATHCGMCGRACSGQCTEGQCFVNLDHVRRRESCATLCAESGLQCSQAFGHYSNDTCAEMVACSQVPPSTSSECNGTAFVDVYCKCVSP